MRSKIAVVKIFKPTSSGPEGILHSFKFPDTKLEFSVVSDASKEPGTCVVSIFGVSVESFQMFETIDRNKYSDRQRVEVLYGSESGDPNHPERDLEIVFSGGVERVVYDFDGGKQTMKIVCGERSSEYFSKSFAIMSQEELQVGDLMAAVSSKFGYTIEYEKGSEDVELMPVGKVSETGTIKRILDKNLPKGVSFYHSNDKIILYKGARTGTRIMRARLGMELLEYPTVDTQSNKVSLVARILPNIASGVVFEVPATSKSIFSRKEAPGVYRYFIVDKYKIDFKNGVGTMNLECSEKKE